MTKYLALLIFLFSALGGQASFAGDRRELHVQGQILKADSSEEEAASVAFQIKVYDETMTCVLWSESQTLNMTSSNGYFSFDVGITANRLTGVTQFADVFSNILTYGATSDCPIGYLVNGSNPDRFLQVSFNDGSGLVALSAQVLKSSPYSMDSARLAGYQATDFLLKAGLPTCGAGTFLTWDGANLTCATLTGSGNGSVTNVSSANSYMSVATGTTTPVLTLNIGTTANTLAAGNDSRIVGALQSGATAGGDLTGTYPNPTIAKLAGNPVSLTTASTGQYIRYSGSAYTNSNLLASDLSGTLTAASLPAFTGDATSAGGSANLSLAAVGTAGTYEKVMTDAKGRVTSGSLLSNSDVTTALGYSPVSRIGDTMTGSLGHSAGTGDAYFNSGNTFSVNLHAASALSSNISLTLPTSLGTSGQVLSTDGAGNMIWTTGAAGNVTSVSGTGAISVATGTTTPVISIATAGTSTTGALSSTDWNTFNGKQSSSLVAGDLWVGNSSGVATAVQPSGDVTMTNAGVITILKLAGNPLSVTTPATGQYLRYSGTSFVNSSLLASDLSGTMSATNMPAFTGDATSTIGTTALTLASIGSAGTYEKVMTDAKGRVTSGANLNAADITTALLFTPVNKAGDTMSGSLVHSAGTGDTYFNTGNTFSINLRAPSSLGANISLNLPATLGTSGQVLTTDGTGNTSWTSTAVGSVTNVSGTGAISVATGTTTPVISIATAGTTTTGALSSTDWNTFNGKQSTGLVSGDLWIGNTSGVATAVLPSGDVTITNAGAMTILKLAGNPLSVTTPAAGQYLRYSGTTFVNSSLLASDLSGTMSATSMPAFSGDATSTAGTTALTLASIGTPGSYPKVITDSKGRVTAGTVLSSGDVTTGLGYTPVNKAGDTMTGSLTHNIGTGDIYYNTAGTLTSTVKASSAVISNTNFTLPSSNGVVGQVLSTDGSGNTTWVSAAIGSVTNVSGTGAISVATGTTTPVISIAAAGTSTTGALSNTDWNTFNSKQSTNLAAGDIWVGNISGVATAAAPGGDLSMNSAGAFSLTKISGTSLSVIGLASGQYLRYGGSTWSNAAMPSADVTNALGYTPINPGQMPANCTANQTLTFSSPTGTWACSSILITGSAFASQAQATFLAAPTGAAGTSSFRTIASTDLPSSVVQNGGNTFGATAEIGTNDSNNVNFRANGADVMTVAASGFVGVNNTNPSTSLDVNGPVTMRHGYFETVGALGTVSCGSTNITGFTTNIYTVTACSSATTTLNIPAITGWPAGTMAWNVTFFVTGQTASVFNVSYNGATTNVFWDKNSTTSSGGSGFAGISVNSGNTSLISCAVLNTGSVTIYCGVGAQY